MSDLLWAYAGLGYLIWGTGKKVVVDAYLPWYLEFPTDIAVVWFANSPRTAAAARTLAVKTGRGTVWATRVAWGSRAGLASRGLVATGAMFASAAALGYAIGAVVGTGISQHLFGDEGAQDALDFYSGNVSWDDYWSTVANIWQ